jgi:hypothetical protein
MPSCLGVKEIGFIKELNEWNIAKLQKKYSPSYMRLMKRRLIEKRRFLTNDLLMINSVLEELRSL